ncbi:MAG: tRNA uridine-5-carboxymethylaminomethyl(34) synthesis enzyme MnmG [Elusimicrobia bacterium]|nr:tRNA uridine-5-carboxymethylaminomethyl(34) synthesis enzyme MnmG [Elusimicrobiota bacterium]
MEKKYNIIIVGAGHAGCEAALTGAKMGLSIILVTLNKNFIASLPCNPAIGGIAKGQIVREIDALGGQMAKAADTAGIQFKILNASRGAAVRSPRAQCDKYVYSNTMRQALENTQNITIHEAEAESLIINNQCAQGIIVSGGEKIFADAVIITSGTFLNGKIFIGKQNFYGGRNGETASIKLSASLSNAGLEVKRFKTSTPPRINAKTIDYSKMEIQPGDNPPTPFSHFTEVKTWQAQKKQVPCWLTYTNQTTHSIIRDYLEESSLYISDSKGPRYCPSIEDKLISYPDRTRHHIFAEPESLSTDEVYLNGLYTGVPEAAQQKLINSISGFENAKIIHYGYAIEYDYFPPTQLKNTLETKTIENLYLAGQINGTTGYEEAAALGLMAGINAALKISNKEPLALNRDNTYIGVLIDDIIIKGVDEPYRMFTSRAQNRLSIRADNADLRMLETGFNIGLIDKTIFEKFSLYKKSLQDLQNTPADAELSPWSIDKIEEERAIIKKYAGYINLQEKLSQKVQKNENRRIPEGFDFNLIKSLSSETKEKLFKILPQTLGEASRISGVAPSDIAILTIYLEKMRREQNGQ